MKTKEFKKIIPQKLRYMSYLSSYCPGIMKIIYKIYDLKTGAQKKYAIRGIKYARMISVIVPIYRVEPYLDRCIRSLVDKHIII